MDDKTEPSAMADMMALKLDGPALVFFRPRHHMPGESLCAFGEALKRSRLTELADFPHVKFVIIPYGFDVMVMGDVELERAGLARLTASETA